MTTSTQLPNHLIRELMHTVVFKKSGEAMVRLALSGKETFPVFKYIVESRGHAYTEGGDIYVLCSSPYTSPSVTLKFRTDGSKRLTARFVQNLLVDSALPKDLHFEKLTDFTFRRYAKPFQPAGSSLDSCSATTMDSSAVLHAYLYAVLKQTYDPMPYLSIPTFELPMMAANVNSNCSAYDATVPAAAAQPTVKPLPEKLPFNINSILEQRITDAPSTLSPPSAMMSTPSSRPISMSSAHPTTSVPLSSPSPAPPTIKKRVTTTPAIRKILSDWFNDHLDYPYLDDESTLMLMEKTCLSRTQLKNRFTNHRRSFEQQHGHVKWIKKPAPAYARRKRPAQRDAEEPAKKIARIFID